MNCTDVEESIVRVLLTAGDDGVGPMYGYILYKIYVIIFNNKIIDVESHIPFKDCNDVEESIV